MADLGGRKIFGVSNTRIGHYQRRLFAAKRKTNLFRRIVSGAFTVIAFRSHEVGSPEDPAAGLMLLAPLIFGRNNKMKHLKFSVLALIAIGLISFAAVM